MSVSAFSVVHKGVPKLMKARYLSGEDVPYYVAERMQAHVIGRGVASGNMPTSKIPEARKARYKSKRRVAIDQSHKPKPFTDARHKAENKHAAAKKARRVKAWHANKKAEKTKAVAPPAPALQLPTNPPKPKKTPQPQTLAKTPVIEKVPSSHTKRNAIIGSSLVAGGGVAGSAYYYKQKKKTKQRLSAPLPERIRRNW